MVLCAVGNSTSKSSWCHGLFFSLGNEIGSDENGTPLGKYLLEDFTFETFGYNLRDNVAIVHINCYIVDNLPKPLPVTYPKPSPKPKEHETSTTPHQSPPKHGQPKPGNMKLTRPLTQSLYSTGLIHSVIVVNFFLLL